MSLFIGSGVALITPFTENLQVDYNTLKNLIEWHILMHTDALIICGTTAESATLTDDEKKRIIEFSIRVANKRVPVIAGTGSNSTAHSIELSKFAESVGADGLLIVTPYYNKPTQCGLIAHYEAIADEVHLPIILYNVPGRTAVNLEVDTVVTLSKHKNIVAIKEASGNMKQIAELLNVLPNDFDLYSGNDDQTEDILKLGGKGVISVTANIAPTLVHEIAIGEKSNDPYQELHRVMFVESNPIPVKHALNYLGIQVGGYRLPLTPMSEDHVKDLESVLDVYHLKEGTYESFN